MFTLSLTVLSACSNTNISQNQSQFALEPETVTQIQASTEATTELDKEITPKEHTNTEILTLSESKFNQFVAEKLCPIDYIFNIKNDIYEDFVKEFGITKAVVLSDERAYLTYKSPQGGDIYVYFWYAGGWATRHSIYRENILKYADFGDLTGKTAEDVAKIDSNVNYYMSRKGGANWLSQHLLEDGLLTIWYNSKDTVYKVMFDENYLYINSNGDGYDYNTDFTLQNEIIPTKYKGSQILTLSEESFNTLMKEEVEMIDVVECMQNRKTEYLHSLSYFSKKYGETKAVEISDNTAYSIYKSPQGGYVYVYFYDVGGNYWCKSHIAYRENVLRYDDFKVLTGGLTPAELKALNSVKGEIPHYTVADVANIDSGVNAYLSNIDKEDSTWWYWDSYHVLEDGLFIIRYNAREDNRIIRMEFYENFVYNENEYSRFNHDFRIE